MELCFKITEPSYGVFFPLYPQIKGRGLLVLWPHMEKKQVKEVEHIPRKLCMLIQKQVFDAVLGNKIKMFFSNCDEKCG